MGQLLFHIGRSTWFRRSTERRLSRFVRDRNRLVHNIFREPQFKSPQRRRDLERVHRLASRIFDEAIYFEELFDGLLGMQLELSLGQGEIDIENRASFLEVMREKEERGVMRELMKSIKVPK